MTRYPCLLFDANIVIKLYELGLWAEVLSRCELILTETVVDEANFFCDSEGIEHAIDLRPEIADGRLRVVSLSGARIAAFRDEFDSLYVQKLDDGETESLVYCLDHGEPYAVCSADGIVFRVLALLDRFGQDVSLEEVLNAIGLSRQLPDQFTKRFREKNRQQGFQDRLAGIGLKRA